MKQLQKRIGRDGCRLQTCAALKINYFYLELWDFICTTYTHSSQLQSISEEAILIISGLIQHLSGVFLQEEAVSLLRFLFSLIFALAWRQLKVHLEPTKHQRHSTM